VHARAPAMSAKLRTGGSDCRICRHVAIEIERSEHRLDRRRFDACQAILEYPFVGRWARPTEMLATPHYN
jgi:hypothetical protein